MPGKNLGLVALALVVSVMLGAAPAFADSPPAVTIAAPSGVSYTSAHVSGTVNPEGGPSSTIWNLEYKPASADEFSWVPFASGELSGPGAEATTAGAVQGDVLGLAPGTEYVVRLVAENEFGAHRVLTAEPDPGFTTLAVAAPVVSISPASSITGTTAHFVGKIEPQAPAGNPSAFDVSWHFECTPECPGLAGGSIPADNAAHTVEADAASLLYNTSYEVKLVASNAGGEASAVDSVKTQAVAPVAKSSPVGTLSSTTAIVGGTVDPRGSATTYGIEYADNEAFTNATSVPAAKDASAGSGQAPVIVSRLLSALQPDRGYYFRIVAQNAVDTSVSATRAFRTRPVEATQGCTNEAFRTGPSAGLPDCRAYELVTPDLAHASGGSQHGGQVTADGKTFLYETVDGPSNARSANLFNITRATRDASKGWSGVSMAPPMPAPSTVFEATLTVALSADLSSTAEVSDQPLSGGVVPDGQNFFVSRPDGSYRLLTNVGGALQPFLDIYNYRGIAWGNPDFSQVYLQPTVAQLPSDPSPGSSTYAWSEDRGLRLVGVLPNGTLAPHGAGLVSGVLQPASDDGKYVAFTTDGKLYLRIDDAQTVELGPIEIDPTRASLSDKAGLAPDGSKLLFTSRTELTSDANTGETGGVPNQSGRDLYSYDTASGELTDLTADLNPADNAKGADVQTVLGTTASGSYIYFTATGTLTSDATPGQVMLYVWHEGHTKLVTTTGATSPYQFYVTPDGHHGAFTSSASLTGYDNTDPVTNEPHSEVFKFTLESGLECVSCRPDGTHPTGESFLPGYSGLGPAGKIREMSDDGKRVFFESKDAVIPQASNGFKQVFEYSNGRVSALSRLDGTFGATFLDATPSGDDVFLNTYDALVADPNNGDYAVVDARVDGGFPVAADGGCSGVACQGPAAPAPASPVAGSVGFVGEGNLKDASVRSKAALRVVVSKLKTISGKRGSLAVKVPGKGRLTVSGAGLQTKRVSLSKARTVTVGLSPSANAARALRREGSFRTKVRVVFSDVGGRTSSVSLSITFKAASGRKGR